MIWLTGSALGICMLMIAGLILVILTNGLSFFWPKTLEQVKLQDGTVLLGELVGREGIPNPGQPDHLEKFRIQLRLGNRDLSGSDFRWVDEADIASRELPARGLLRRTARVRPPHRHPGAGEAGREDPGRGARRRCRSSCPSSWPEPTTTEAPSRRSRRARSATSTTRSRRPGWRAGASTSSRARTRAATSRRSAPRSRRGRRRRRPSSRARPRSCRSSWRARGRPTSPSAPPTARRRSFVPSTCTAPTPRTSSPGSAAWGSTAGASGSSSATTPASRTPKAASSPPSSAP